MQTIFRILLAVVLAASLGAPLYAQSRAGGGSQNEGDGTQRQQDRPRIRSADIARTSGRQEYVVLGPPAEVDLVARALVALDARILRDRALPALRQRLLVVDLRRRLTLPTLVDLTRQAAPNARADLHVIYRYAAGSPKLYAPQLVGLPQNGACPLGRAVRVGVIDGPVDAGHPALQSAGVVAHSVLNSEDKGAKTGHGTAVAALIAGQDGTGALTGFAPGARLFAAAAFARERGGPGADVERIAMALDWLLGQNVRLVNMSFAGPDNAALELLLAAAARRGAVMVAAAGNDGRNLAAWPAASPNVIAVTAVDAATNRYHKANYGSHIEFAAPGVDLYVAKGSKGAYASGTSYSAPIVTALAARLISRGAGSANAVRAGLRNAATDLGDPGHDARFGWGLVHASGC